MPKVGRVVCLGAAAVLLAACGQASNAGSSDAQRTELDGTFLDAGGSGFVFTRDGHLTTVGHPAPVGTYTQNGTQLVAKLPSGQGAFGALEGPNQLLLSINGDPAGKPRFVRQGAGANPSPGTMPSQPPKIRSVVDRTVPLDRYTDLTYGGTSEGLALLRVAFQDPPATAEEKARWLLKAGDEADAFKRRERIEAGIAGLDARLETIRQQRYYALTLDAATLMYQAGRIEPGHDFPMLDGQLGGQFIGPYDIDRKGFPVACFASQTLRGTGIVAQQRPTVALTFDREERVPNACFLPLPDEATARALEAARVQHGTNLTVVRATVYFHVSRVYDAHNVSAVLTHASVQYGLTPAPGKPSKAIGPVIEVDFPQAAAP